jgi:Arc/MetJ-type ribon-helix-helix transcriptional regulator
VINESGREKITFRVSKQLLAEIDDFVKMSDTYASRSDFIRDLIKRGKTTILTLDSSPLMLHNKAFREILKTLNEEEMEKVTEKTASIIHSILQDKKKVSLDKIRDLEVLTFISEIYEAMNIVKEMHYRLEGNNVIMCLTGENLHSKTYTDYIHAEIKNVMKPWFKLKTSSATPGSLVLTFELNGYDYTRNVQKFTLL